ncbi:MAG TPA: hypothetical protein VGC92_05910, partial [Phenylobacterium sp.]
IGSFPARSAATGFGHAGLTWRVSPKDLLQLDLVTTAKGLNPQGYSSPTYAGNIGYRHVVNDNVSWILAVKDPFRTLRYRSVEKINGVEERRVTSEPTRSVSLTLAWTFAGKPRRQGFDFEPDDSRR